MLPNSNEIGIIQYHFMETYLLSSGHFRKKKSKGLPSTEIFFPKLICLLVPNRTFSFSHTSNYFCITVFEIVKSRTVQHQILSKVYQRGKKKKDKRAE